MSPSFALPVFVKKTFADLRSQCMMFKSCIAFKPSVIEQKIVQISRSCKNWLLYLPWSILWSKSPPSTSSITILTSQIRRHLPQGVRWPINESFLIADNERTPERGKQAHLVNSVLLFFLPKLVHIDSFQRVLLSVCVPLHLVHVWVASLACRISA